MMFVPVEHTAEMDSSHYNLHITMPKCSEKAIASLCRMRKKKGSFSLNLIPKQVS